MATPIRNAHADPMAYVRVKPDDLDQVNKAVAILEAAAEIDDPDHWPLIPELHVGFLKYGWDMEPGDQYLYVPDGSDEPVGVLDIEMPKRDNLQLVWCGLVVHPDHRRQGHGTAMAEEVVRRTSEANRSIIWTGTAEDDEGSRAFAERLGFKYASHDARRRQVLADVDWAEVDRLEEKARAASEEYALERVVAPIDDKLLAELIEVTAAINDAPMGELTFEPEVFDLDRLRAVEQAREGRGDTIYRILARHRETGVVGGHTLVAVNPLRPDRVFQGDTAVHRDHRGHRLGMALKIDMMRWLADVEPGIEVIETWNNADNTFMISVNESIGYRLSRIFATHERKLTD